MRKFAWIHTEAAWNDQGQSVAFWANRMLGGDICPGFIVLIPENQADVPAQLFFTGFTLNGQRNAKFKC